MENVFETKNGEGRPAKKILVVDFGGQYSQIIVRKIRELGVFCEIVSYDFDFGRVKAADLFGIIFSGGPKSVNCEKAFFVDKNVFELGVPVLGICYGAQLIAKIFDGQVESAEVSEYGQTSTKFDLNCKLFKNMPQISVTWMSHFDRISKLPVGFEAVASSESSKIAAMQNVDRKIFAVQFHPEVSHTEFGEQILYNFLFEICCCEKNWCSENFVKILLEQIKSTVNDKKVLLALSGGVDSCVLAALLSKAIGNNLTAVFIDNGLMRKNEVEEVKSIFSGWKMNFVVVDGSSQFLNALKGVVDPEKKRMVVGEQFIRLFEQEAEKIGKVSFLAQGTIYSDWIESGQKESASLIKSHHNVGGLPENIAFDEIIEPLKVFFKDEIRQIGRLLGLPEKIVNRQPFPGPGLSIRVLGEVTKAKLAILREADYIFRKELELCGLSKRASQFFAVLSNVKSVGVKGDVRSYDYMVILRAVETFDFMTASFVKIPYEVLAKVAFRIVNEVEGVNRVVYDVTTKPPATIEFE